MSIEENFLYFSDENNLIKTYEVFTEIPDGTITTFDSSGGNKNGWGYNVLIKGGNSPRAWMDCKISVSGMSGTSYTLSLEVTFP